MGRKSDARQRMLTSAIALMSERGYAGVGVDDILESAGVGKSSFYHFFPSKERLAVEAVGEYAHRAEEAILGEVFSGRVAPLERPVELVRRMAEACRSQDHLTGCLAGAVAAGESTPDMREAAGAVFTRIERGLTKAFSEAIADHDLRPDAPVQKLAGACVAYLYGVLLLARVRQSPAVVTDLGSVMPAIWRPYVT